MQPAKATAAGAAGVVVLDAVALHDLRAAIVEPHGHGEGEFADGVAQKFRELGIEFKERRHFVELRSSCFARAAVAHVFPPAPWGARQTRCSCRTILRAPPYQAGRQFLGATTVSNRFNCWIFFRRL